MTIISHEIDKINDSYKRLKYNKLIPCNCEECQGSQEPYFYRFQALQNLISKTNLAQCQNSGLMVNARNLIDDVVIWQDDKLNHEDRYPGNIDSSPPLSPFSVNIINTNSSKGDVKVSQDNRKLQIRNVGRDVKLNKSPVNSDKAKINDQVTPSAKKKLINWGIILAIISIFASFTGGLMNPEIRKKLGLDPPTPIQELPEDK